MTRKNKQRLELTWIGKEQRPKLEPRILLEDKAKSYHAAHRVSEQDSFDNMLIHGDNLLALKALETNYAGKIKCIFIDPPYNTDNAYEHYDDGLENSIWLTLMRDRLELLYHLLTNDGVLWITLDERQIHYCKVICDEIFGRKNFCGQMVWEKKKKPSFLKAQVGIITDYILPYAKNIKLVAPFIYGVTTAGKKFPFNNAGNGVKTLTFPKESVEFGCPDQIFEAQDMSQGNIITKLLDKLIVEGGYNKNIFRLEGEWRYSQNKLDEIIKNDERIIISKSPFRPNHIKEGGKPKKMHNLLSRAHYDMATNEDAEKESKDLFGAKNSFDYPKPEKLIQTLIGATTQPGDLVLDSFAGSGTTGAVAHKMNRRWIMVELGEHCHTHILPRLKKVIDGNDQGGISKAQNWQGGGGFRYFTIAPSLLKKDKWGRYIVNKAFNPEMLAEALCQQAGFTYQPNPDVWWQHGFSSEHDFIYATTQTFTHAQLAKLSAEVGDDRTLFIYCSGFKARLDQFANLTVCRIPPAILQNCEWDRDDYSLKVQNLPYQAGTQTTMALSNDE